MNAECWVWTGTHTQGFGQYRVISGRNVLVHRVMAEFVFGSKFDAFDRRVRWIHLCRKDCVNPFHLVNWTGKTWKEVKSKVIKLKRYVKIICTSGLVSKVDLKDYDLVKDRNWHTQKGEKTHYAVCRDEGKKLYLHHLIVGHGGQNVDHWNENGLDNRRSNIRQCTFSENRQGVRFKNKRHRYVGVSLDLRPHLSRRWGSKIIVHGKTVWLKRHATEVDAAKAYNKAALKFYGEKAKLNNV